MIIIKKFSFSCKIQLDRIVFFHALVERLNTPNQIETYIVSRCVDIEKREQIFRLRDVHDIHIERV